jgi:hypothetical protein
MRRPGALLLLLLLLLLVPLVPLLSPPALGQGGTQAQVTLTVDRHIATVGEPMQVTVSILVQGRMGYERYIPPSFAGFQVAGGGMTTQNIEMINWKVRRREGHTYTVVPLRAGTLKVGPAAVLMAGRRFSSQTVTIKVRKGSGPTPAPGPGPGGPSAPGAPSAPDAGTGAAPGIPADGQPLRRVFLAAQATPEKVYLGQQVVVTWYLYTQSDVLGFHTTGQPTTDHFWSEDLKSPRRLEMERRVVQNRLFYVAVIARKALFPQKVGKLTVGSMSAQVRTMDQFAGAAVRISSESPTVEVLPLPDAGKPANFSEENVGRYDVMASLDRDRVKAGEGVTLKLVVRGHGNLRQVKAPQVTELDGFKVYKPKVTESLQVNGGVSGEKIVEYLLMPTRGGKLRIPALALDYFDPAAGAYKRSSTDPLTLHVTGKLPAHIAGAGPAAKNVIGPTIRPPRPARALSHRDPTPVHRQPLFLVFLVLPVAVLVVVSGGERLRARMKRETPGSLRRAASRRTREHLHRARDLRDGGDPVRFYAAIASGLRSLLDHRLGAPIEGLTRSELQERMARAGFSAELVAEVIGELDACDAARFAPSAASQATSSRERALQRAHELVDRLGRAQVQR